MARRTLWTISPDILAQPMEVLSAEVDSVGVCQSGPDQVIRADLACLFFGIPQDSGPGSHADSGVREDSSDYEDIRGCLCRQFRECAGSSLPPAWRDEAKQRTRRMHSGYISKAGHGCRFRCPAGCGRVFWWIRKPEFLYPTSKRWDTQSCVSPHHKGHTLPTGNATCL